MKAMFLVFGTISLGVGILGAFLPVLPTTPFILLAAICYVRSSARMYGWVMRSRFAGKHVQNVLDGKGIPLSVKVTSVAISVCMIGYVAFFRTENVWLRLLLGLVLVVQVYFMARIKTLRTESNAHQTTR